jgi:hypothetical protein
MPKVFQNKPIAEITLRKFERPLNEDLDELIKKFCISIGMLQPGDSRDVVVPILKLLLFAKKENKILSSKEIEEKVKAQRSIAGSNIRRQLLRLEQLHIIEKNSGGYRIKEFLSLKEILNNHIKPFLLEPALKRIEEYTEAIERKL